MHSGVANIATCPLEVEKLKLFKSSLFLEFYFVPIQAICTHEEVSLFRFYIRGVEANGANCWNGPEACPSIFCSPCTGDRRAGKTRPAQLDTDYRLKDIPSQQLRADI